MYDLLIKGGRVIDPAQNTDALMDVAVPCPSTDWFLDSF
jgi:predicted amidohydrolase